MLDEADLRRKCPNVRFGERRAEFGGGIYFSVRTRGGRKHSCLVTDSGPLAFGLADPPDCARGGQPVQRFQPI